MATRRKAVPQVTRRMEDYLAAALYLELQGMAVTVTALARRLGVAKPSVVSCVRRLIGAGLVQHEQYGKIHLTDEGRNRALPVYRRHRFLCDFVGSVLFLPPDRAALLACDMEHHFDEKTEQHLFRVMDVLESRFDRSALKDLIGDEDQEKREKLLPLSLLEKGQKGRIRHFLGDGTARERGHSIGLVPGRNVRCLLPLGEATEGHLVVALEGEEKRLVTGSMALCVWCVPFSGERPSLRR